MQNQQDDVQQCRDDDVQKYCDDDVQQCIDDDVQQCMTSHCQVGCSHSHDYSLWKLGHMRKNIEHMNLSFAPSDLECVHRVRQ